jgi:two-component system response regulator YesN
LYLRYGRYYIFMFLLPMIIMGLFLYFGVLNNLEKEIRKNQRDDLVLLSRTYEEEIERLNSTARQIQLSHTFTHQSFLYDPIYGREIIDTLKMFSSLNPVIDTVMVYFKDHPYIYSDMSTLSLDFFPTYFTMENLRAEEMILLIETTDFPRFYGPDKLSLTGEIHDSVILYLFPLISSGIKSGTVIMQISSDSLLSIYTKDETRKNRYFFMTTGEGKTIFSYSPDKSNDSIGIEQTLNGVNENMIKIEGTRYLMDQIISDNNDLIYTSLTPYTLIRDSLRPIILILLAILTLLIILGGVITLFFTRKTYQPIAQLKEISRSIESSNNEEEEILFIRNTLLTLISENKNLIENSQISQSSRKKEFIFKLLKGSVMSDESMEDQGEEFHFIGTDYVYASGIIRLIEKNKPLAEGIINSLEKTISHEAEICMLIREAMDERTFYFVLSRKNKPPNELKLNEIKGTVDRFLGPQSLYLGSFSPGWRDLSRSFLEAQICMEYGYISPTGRLIYYPLLSEENRTADLYSPSQLYTFRQSIRDRDNGAFTNSLNGFVEKVMKAPYQIRHVKALTFDLKNTFLLGVRDLEKTYPIPQTLFRRIEELHREDTFLLFCSSLEEIFKSLETYCADNSRKTSGPRRHKYIVYIENKYRNPDLSLDTMADDFNMSSAGFSRSFKKHIHVGFMEYLSYIRIEKSKNLLSETDMVLQDIAEEVGYTNVPSFIRRFRQREGLTPGEYRKMTRTS